MYNIVWDIGGAEDAMEIENKLFIFISHLFGELFYIVSLVLKYL